MAPLSNPHRSSDTPGRKRRARARAIPALLCLTFSLLAPSLITSLAFGTTVITVDADRLVRDADQIAHVRCTGCESYRNEDGLIVTRYRFAVLETLKGTPVQTLECVQPGGRIGNLVTVVPGLKSYRTDQELVLFLSPQEAGTSYRLPVGLAQGVYRIETDRSSGVRIARRDLRGLHQIPAKPSPPTGSDAESAEQTAKQNNLFEEGLPVADFKAKVRERVRLLNKKQRGDR